MRQMDKAITVISPVSWLVLGALTLIVVVMLVWSFAAKIPKTVSTVGVVMKPANTSALYAPEAGRIIEISVHENQKISAGEKVAKYRVSERGADQEIRATQNGFVTKVMVNNNTDVNHGDDIIHFTPEGIKGIDQVVVCYVNQSDANKLKAGMKATVSLQSADSQTYGHMDARIVSIDAFPATDAGMQLVLGKDNGRIADLKGQNTSVVAVTCQLRMADKSHGTESGYWWSNRRGAKMSVDDNAPVNVKFIVEEVRPITWLFSKMKELWEEE